MKNRKLLYMLIPATVIVWGVIAFSIINQFRAPDDDLDRDYIPFVSKDSDTVLKTYELLANYRDPFRAGSVRSDISDENRNRLRNANRNANVQPRYVYWPAIEYQGVIMNNKIQVALIRIENSNLLMKEGEEQQQIKILKIYGDSVQLTFQGEKKVFKKK